MRTNYTKYIYTDSSFLDFILFYINKDKININDFLEIEKNVLLDTLKKNNELFMLFDTKSLGEIHHSLN